MAHMSPRSWWEVDQDAEKLTSARLDQDVLTEQSALLHAQEYFISPDIVHLGCTEAFKRISTRNKTASRNYLSVAGWCSRSKS